MKNLIEDIQLSKLSYLIEILEKRSLKEKLKAFKKLEKFKITRNMGLFLIENSTKNFDVMDEFGGINSSLIELCFKNYFPEYNDAIRNVFKDLSNEAQDRVLYLLTTRDDIDTLSLYSDLVVKYYKDREIIPIGELSKKPLAYPYLFPNLFKALKFKSTKNNILILLNDYLNSGVVLKQDLTKNKKLVIDSICKLFDEALTYKFKNTYEGLHKKEYKSIRYYLEVAINIDTYLNSKKIQSYFIKILKKNDNQLKLFILDNYIRKNHNLKNINFEPISKDKASRYALFELLTIYDKLSLMPKKYNNQLSLAESDFYTNFVISTSYTKEPKNLKFYKTIEKNNFEYYIFKFDYKYKFDTNKVSNDYLTNYIYDQLKMDKYNGEVVTNKFIGISGGYSTDVVPSVILKNHRKLLISKIYDDDIEKIVNDLLKEPVKKDEPKSTKKKEKKKKEPKEKIKKEKVISDRKLKKQLKKEEKEKKKVKEKEQFEKIDEIKDIINSTEEINNQIKETQEVIQEQAKKKEKKKLHIFSYILLFLFAVYLGLFVYCILYIYGVASINDGIDKDIINPVNLKDKGNFTEILGTEIFNQEEAEYFVLIYTGAKSEKNKYYRYINEYSKRKYRFYFVDLKNNENKFLYGPNDLGFTVYTDRFVKVKDKEYEYYVDGKTNILNEMQTQIEEILRKEQEEAKKEKQAKLDEEHKKEEEEFAKKQEEKNNAIAKKTIMKEVPIMSKKQTKFAHVDKVLLKSYKLTKK